MLHITVMSDIPSFLLPGAIAPKKGGIMFAWLFVPFHVAHQAIYRLTCTGTSTGTDDISKILTTITNLLDGIGAAGVTLAIVYTGFLFLTSGSSPQGMEKAKISLRNTVLGALFIFAASAVSTFITTNILGCTSA